MGEEFLLGRRFNIFQFDWCEHLERPGKTPPGNKIIQFFFVGFALSEVRQISTGDIRAADIEGMENLEASVIRALRFNAKEFHVPKSADTPVFLVAHGARR